MRREHGRAFAICATYTSSTEQNKRNNERHTDLHVCGSVFYVLGV